MIAAEEADEVVVRMSGKYSLEEAARSFEWLKGMGYLVDSGSSHYILGVGDRGAGPVASTIVLYGQGCGCPGKSCPPSPRPGNAAATACWIGGIPEKFAARLLEIGAIGSGRGGGKDVR